GIDKDYGRDSNWLDFDSSNRLVSSSYDGFIRLYDSAFNLIEKKKELSGKKPHSIHFSPDGKLIAVGYNDSSKVDLYSGQSTFFLRNFLSHITTLESADLKVKNLEVVTFSKKGDYLYAGGSMEDNSKTSVIRRWNLGKLEEIKDYSTQLDRITGIFPLIHGSFFLSALPSSFQILNEEGNSTFLKKSAILNFRHIEEEFYISRDARVVHLQVKGANPLELEFSLSKKKLEMRTIKNTAHYLRPNMAVVGYVFKDWKNSKEPLLNDKPIKLAAGEICKSITISTNEKFFVLGTNRSLYRMDMSGNVVWKTNLNREIRVVNISAADEFIVAAHSDGTIRWYRFKDGIELFGLYLHSNGRDWLLFTPEGFYETNSKDEDFLSWTLNMGRKLESINLPIIALRKHYRRSDILQRAILNQKTAEETVTNASLVPPDIRSITLAMTENLKSSLELENHESNRPGKAVARVFSVDLKTEEILIAHYQVNPLLFQKSKLFIVEDDGLKVYLTVTHPKSTISRCILEDELKKHLNNIKLNSTVYIESSPETKIPY
ncbi:MAG: hypothetical protein KDK45_21590, partial [Leptospiraceae bacterium]|nr:hypothetical protein [Leptospiraceae bacterium]